MKTKKLVVLLLALCLLLSITTSALAATNYFHWGYVYGGTSQSLCTMSATRTDNTLLYISDIELNGDQEYISFRPYKGTSKLTSPAVEIDTADTYYLAYNNNITVSVGDAVRLVASIPTSAPLVFCRFYGYATI